MEVKYYENLSEPWFILVNMGIKLLKEEKITNYA